jgi:uncharacterized protein YciI
MPLFVLIGRDHPHDLARRLQHRPAHLEAVRILDASGRVRHGGPLKNDRGEIIGSLLIFEADSLEAAKKLVAADPYVVGGVFASYEVLETEAVFPRVH